MTTREEVSVECAFGAVTIEPFEVSRWRGGCGLVYGISIVMWGKAVVFGWRRAEGGAMRRVRKEAGAGGRQRGPIWRGAGAKRA